MQMFLCFFEMFELSAGLHKEAKAQSNGVKVTLLPVCHGIIFWVHCGRGLWILGSFFFNLPFTAISSPALTVCSIKFTCQYQIYLSAFAKMTKKPPRLPAAPWIWFGTGLGWDVSLHKMHPGTLHLPSGNSHLRVKGSSYSMLHINSDRRLWLKLQRGIHIGKN